MSAETVPQNIPYDAVRAEADLESLTKLDRQIEWYEMAIESAKQRKEEINARLVDLAINFRRTVGRSRLSLANGALSITKRRERVDIVDEAAFATWCLANGHTKPKPSFTLGKAALSFTGTGEAFAANGEVVPSVKKYLPGPDDFSVKITVGAKLEAPEEE